MPIVNLYYAVLLPVLTVPAAQAGAFENIKTGKPMNGILLIAGLCPAAGIANAGSLCSVNPYTKSEAEEGRTAFDSHCALCHQYSMQGRGPGRYLHESAILKLLSEGDVRFLGGSGGNVPPLVGAKFFAKEQGKSLLEFSYVVSSAATTFPPRGFELPKAFFQIAAYVLYRNCGKI